MDDILWKLLLLAVYSCGLVSSMEVTRVVLDDPDVCKSSQTDKIYWADPKKGVLVIGRGSNNRQEFFNCTIVVGAATDASSILQLSFDAFYINNCGAMLSINQSRYSNFLQHNNVLARITCDHGKVTTLHTEEKHFVKISMQKTQLPMQEYNFRINITVAETGVGAYKGGDVSTAILVDSLAAQVNDTKWKMMNIRQGRSANSTAHGDGDKMPETGPALHVVIIVGCVMVVVVGISLWLLCKYLSRRMQRWQEVSAERNMERAIHLYNNQQNPPESDYMYTALPAQGVSTTQNGRNASSPHHHGKKGGRSRPHHAGDISFVHPDGHIETFRIRSTQDRNSNSGSDSNAPSSRSHRSSRPINAPTDRVRGLGTDNGSGGDFADVRAPSRESIIGDCPPSYEEALNMPCPEDTQDEPPLPLYVNLGDKDKNKGDDHDRET